MNEVDSTQHHAYLVADGKHMQEVYSAVAGAWEDNEPIHGALVLVIDAVLNPGDVLPLRIAASSILSDVRSDVREIARRQAENSAQRHTILGCLCRTSAWGTPEGRQKISDFAACKSGGDGGDDGDTNSAYLEKCWFGVGCLVEVERWAEGNNGGHGGDGGDGGDGDGDDNHDLVMTVRAHRRFGVTRVVTSRGYGAVVADLRVLPEHSGESPSGSRVGVMISPSSSATDRHFRPPASSCIPAFISSRYSLRGLSATALRLIQARLSSGGSGDMEEGKRAASMAARDPHEFCWYVCKNYFPRGNVAKQMLLATECTVMRYLKLIEALKADTESGGGMVIACSRCGWAIAPVTAAFAVAGAGGNCGNYVNPHGIVHQTFTVRTLVNPLRSLTVHDAMRPESKDSWFKGYAWAIATCGQCNSHIGWRFSRVDCGSLAPHRCGDGKYDGNIQREITSTEDILRYLYWYRRLMLDISESNGDPQQAVPTFAQLVQPLTDGPGVPPEPYTLGDNAQGHPGHVPHPLYTPPAGPGQSDHPLVFYGLASSSVATRPVDALRDDETRYGIATHYSNTMGQLLSTAVQGERLYIEGDDDEDDDDDEDEDDEDDDEDEDEDEDGEPADDEYEDAIAID
jgi:hypothetical protein